MDEGEEGGMVDEDLDAEEEEGIERRDRKRDMDWDQRVWQLVESMDPEGARWMELIPLMEMEDEGESVLSLSLLEIFSLNKFSVRVSNQISFLRRGTSRNPKMKRSRTRGTRTQNLRMRRSGGVWRRRTTDRRRRKG